MSSQSPNSQEQPKMVALCPFLLWGFRACPQLRQLFPGSHRLPGPRAHRMILQTRLVNWAPSLSPTHPPCLTLWDSLLGNKASWGVDKESSCFSSGHEASCQPGASW